MHVSPIPPAVPSGQRYTITLLSDLRSAFPVVGYIKSVEPDADDIDIPPLSGRKPGSIVIRMATHNFLGPHQLLARSQDLARGREDDPYCYSARDDWIE